LALRQIAHSFLLMGIVVRDIHKTATVAGNYQTSSKTIARERK
jgi:hypothetical protein